MRQTRRHEIQRLANTIREACELSTPLDMDEAVERLNGTLSFRNVDEFEAKIEKLDDGFKITLARSYPPLRKRFSIAHELGHLFLHMGYLIDDDKWDSVGEYTDSVYYRFGHNTEESEANEFAASLLMPVVEFRKIAAANKHGNRYLIGPIADHFSVSTDAARNRGRWLGMFSWE